MRKGLYSIYDSVAKEFAAPFIANNDDHALRLFNNALGQAVKSGFSDDFELYKVAVFNVTTGMIEGAYLIKVVVSAPADPQKDLEFEDK